MSETKRRKAAKQRNARGFSLREDIPGRPWSASQSRLAAALQTEEDVEDWVRRNTQKRDPL